MQTHDFTPEKSLELIAEAIAEARSKFEENGLIYLFWGLLIALATIGQFVLLKTGHQDINWYPYLLMPLGFAASGIYFSRKGRQKKPNLIETITAYSWLLLALNMLVLGFVFATVLQQFLIPVILILQGIGMFVSGSAIRNKLLTYAGVLVNISGLVALRVAWVYQPLLAGIVALIAVALPGLLLMIKHRKNRNV